MSQSLEIRYEKDGITPIYEWNNWDGRSFMPAGVAEFSLVEVVLNNSSEVKSSEANQVEWSKVVTWKLVCN